MSDDSARVAALRLALASSFTPACNEAVAELCCDRGRLLALLFELVELLEEAVEEHSPGGAAEWIESRLAAELDAGRG